MEREQLIQTIQSKENGLDEREKMIKTESYGFAFTGGYIAMMLVVILRGFNGYGFNYDIAMIFTGQITFMAYYLYRNGRSTKLNLFFSIVGAIMFVISTYHTLVYYGII